LRRRPAREIAKSRIAVLQTAATRSARVFACRAPHDRHKRQNHATQARRFANTASGSSLIKTSHRSGIADSTARAPFGVCAPSRAWAAHHPGLRRCRASASRFQRESARRAGSASAHRWAAVPHCPLPSAVQLRGISASESSAFSGDDGRSHSQCRQLV
jgi:hypothetical protein